MSRSHTPLLLAALALLAPRSASAQDGFDAHGFQPASLRGDPRDPLVVQRPRAQQAGEYFVGGLFEFAEAPLVYETSLGRVDTSERALDNLLVLNLSAGVALHERVRAEVTAPLFLASSGFGQPQGVAPGDIRLSGLVVLLLPGEVEGLGIGLVPHFDLPSGDNAAFLGQRAVAGGGRFVATFEEGRTTATADLGMDLLPRIDLGNVVGSDEVSAGLAFGVLATERLGFTAEARLDAPFVASGPLASEVLLSGRRSTPSGAHLLAGGAVGVAQGPGAAAYRVFVGGGYGQSPKPKDSDGDGILNVVDACVDVPEVVNEYEDTDGCPDALGRVEVRATRAGAPVAGAAVFVRGSFEQAYVSTAESYGFDAMPGTAWVGEASLAPCFAGIAGVEAAAGATSTLDVELAPVRDARVTVEVVDSTGAPVPEARLRWKTDAPECAPDEGVVVEPGAAHAVGAGKYEVTAGSPGWTNATAEVEVGAGGEAHVKLTIDRARVHLEANKIVITERVFFETGKAVIEARSFGLLTEVANFIRDDPRIRKIEIAGHTDSQGSDSFNLGLSDRRAQAVLEFLTQAGVEAERLTSKGYGEAVPIAANVTADGRARNRRVEFNILENDGATP